MLCDSTQYIPQLYICVWDGKMVIFCQKNGHKHGATASTTALFFKSDSVFFFRFVTGFLTGFFLTGFLSG